MDKSRNCQQNIKRVTKYSFFYSFSEKLSIAFVNGAFDHGLSVEQIEMAIPVILGLLAVKCGNNVGPKCNAPNVIRPSVSLSKGATVGDKAVATGSLSIAQSYLSTKSSVPAIAEYSMPSLSLASPMVLTERPSTSADAVIIVDDNSNYDSEREIKTEAEGSQAANVVEEPHVPTLPSHSSHVSPRRSSRISHMNGGNSSCPLSAHVPPVGPQKQRKRRQVGIHKLKLHLYCSLSDCNCDIIQMQICINLSTLIPNYQINLKSF